MGATVSGGVGTHHASAAGSDKRLQQPVLVTPEKRWPPSSELEGISSTPDGDRDGAFPAAIPVGAAAASMLKIAGRQEVLHRHRVDNSSKTPHVRNPPKAKVPSSDTGPDVTAVEHLPLVNPHIRNPPRQPGVFPPAAVQHLVHDDKGRAVVPDMLERMDSGWRYGDSQKFDARRLTSAVSGNGANQRVLAADHNPRVAGAAAAAVADPVAVTHDSARENASAAGGPHGDPRNVDAGRLDEENDANQWAVADHNPPVTAAAEPVVGTHDMARENAAGAAWRYDDTRKIEARRLLSTAVVDDEDDDDDVNRRAFADPRALADRSLPVAAGGAAADLVVNTHDDVAVEKVVPEDGGGLGDDEGDHGSDRDCESEAKSCRAFSELSEAEAIAGELIHDHGSFVYYEETERGVGCIGYDAGKEEESRSREEDYSREAVMSSVSDPGGYCARSDGHGTGMTALYSHREMEDETSADLLMSHEVENATTTFLSREEEELAADSASSDSVVSLGELTIIPSPKYATDGGLDLDWRTTRNPESSSARDAEGSVVEYMVGCTNMAYGGAATVDEEGEEGEEEAIGDMDELRSVPGGVTDDEGMKKYYAWSKEEGEADLRSTPPEEQHLEVASGAEEAAMGELRSDPGPCLEANGSDGSDGVKNVDTGVMGSTEVAGSWSNSLLRAGARADAIFGPAIPGPPVKGATGSAAAISSSKRRNWWKSLFGGMKGSVVAKDREGDQKQQGSHTKWKVGVGSPLQGKEAADGYTAVGVSSRSESGVAGTISSKLGWSSDVRKRVGPGHWFKWEKGERLMVETAPAVAHTARVGGEQSAGNHLVGKGGSGKLLHGRSLKGLQLGGARDARSVSVQSAPNLLALVTKEEVLVQPPPTPSSVLVPTALESNKSSWLDLRAIEKHTADAGAMRKTWVMEWLDRLDVSPGAWDVPEEDIIHEEIDNISRPVLEKRGGGTAGNVQADGGGDGKSQWRRSLSLNALTEKNVVESRAAVHVAGGADGVGVGPGAKDSVTVAEMEAAATILQHLDKTASSVAISGQSLKLLPAFGAFSNLRSLDLSRNSIARILPGSLPRSLHVLDLSYNKLSIIEGLRDLTRLQVLKLSSNRLVRIGHGLASCTSLRELYLPHNKISEIEGLHRLLKLTVLDLSHNKLTSMKALGQLAANYKSLQALCLKGNPIVTNVSGEPFRKFVVGLVPHLLYLNQELIKPVPGRDGLNESLAKTVLGPAGYNTQRVSRPRKSHRSSQNAHSKVHSSSNGHQLRGSSQGGPQDGNARRGGPQDGNARRHKSSLTKTSKQNLGSVAKHLHNGSVDGQQQQLPPVELVASHSYYQLRYHDVHYHSQQLDGGIHRNHEEVEPEQSEQVGAVRVVDAGSKTFRPITHVKSKSALASVQGKGSGVGFMQSGEDCTSEFLTGDEPSQIHGGALQTMWEKHLYAVGSFSHWNCEGSLDTPGGEEAANHAFSTMQVRVPGTLGLEPLSSVMAS